MVPYVVIAVFFSQVTEHLGAPAMRITIDCIPEDKANFKLQRGNNKLRAKSADLSSNNFNVDSFCDLLHRAIPKAIKDGRFVQLERDRDQAVESDNHAPISLSAPRNFNTKANSLRIDAPRLRLPKLKIPKIDVPKLKSPINLPKFTAPRMRDSLTLPMFRESDDEESSAEKMDRFKKGIQKLLHFVKVLGQLDQYVSERMRIVIDKLSKTIAE